MKGVVSGKWIDDYAVMIHRSFSHMVPGNWGPVDTFTLIKSLNAGFLLRLHAAIRSMQRKGIGPREAVHFFPSPSSLRADVMFSAYEYQGSDHSHRAEVREVLDFLVETVFHTFKKDMWAYESNIVHTDAEAAHIVASTKWNEGSKEIARELAKLSNSCSALSYALYRDFFPQEANEVYGPYGAEGKFGPGAIMLIKHYPKMRPVELWPDMKDFRYSDIKLHLAYTGVKFHCEFIGMHTVYEGNHLDGLKGWVLEIDGTPVEDIAVIKEVHEYIAHVAARQSHVYARMAHNELVKQTLLWRAYTYKQLFDAAGMDWRDVSKEHASLNGKQVPERADLPSFPSYDEYAASPKWEVYWLKELYRA